MPVVRHLKKRRLKKKMKRLILVFVLSCVFGAAGNAATGSV
jgi:hypothetical protein